MERKSVTPVYVRVRTEYGLISIHADTLILGEDGEDTLYGEIVATTDETRSEGEMFEIRTGETDNEPDYSKFFAPSKTEQITTE